jgi:ATP-dependent helicase HrpB
MAVNVRQLPPLPVDELLGDVLAALESHRAIVVEAPPGSGKTTRLPRALLESKFADAGEIWVAEPRRVAARLAARHVAESLGSELGDRVGYSVRFEERASARTRLRYVTEGVLLRRLGQATADPKLSVVVLDEFHERHLATDLNLMLLTRRLGQHSRKPIRWAVMGAV